jgi:hypothetical protein
MARVAEDAGRGHQDEKERYNGLGGDEYQAGGTARDEVGESKN